jgi:hypothetical protein
VRTPSQTYPRRFPPSRRLSDCGRLSKMPKPKITAAERLVQEQMLAMLEWASDHPDRWHKIGNLDATKKAAELLAARGVIEVWAETGLYRLKKSPVS